MKNLKILCFFTITLLIFSCTEDNESIHVNLNEFENEKRQRSWIDNFTPILPCEAASLTFAIRLNCTGTPYETEILNAIEAYNNTPTSINFTQVSDPLDADLVFNCIAGDICGGGRAALPYSIHNGINTHTTFPSGGTIGGKINLTKDWVDCPCTDPEEEGCNFTGDEPGCMFQRTVMHEIGHVLGIAHNNDKTGDFIPGTPMVDNDPNSVFNSGPTIFQDCNWCDSPCVFNSNDIKALQFIYPEIIAECECPELFPECACEEVLSVTFPSNLEDEDCVPEDHFFAVCAFGWAGDAAPAGTSISWSSTGSITIESENTNARCVDISAGSSGGSISLEITNADCGTISIHRTIEICEEEVGTGNDDPNPNPGPKKGRPKDIE